MGIQNWWEGKLVGGRYVDKNRGWTDGVRWIKRLFYCEAAKIKTRYRFDHKIRKRSGMAREWVVVDIAS